MSKHTPGPWKAESVMGVWVVGTPADKHLIVKVPAGSIDCEANAALIAAAPELLEQLRRMVNCCYRCEGYGIIGSGKPCSVCADARALVERLK